MYLCRICGNTSNFKLILPGSTCPHLRAKILFKLVFQSREAPPFRVRDVGVAGSNPVCGIACIHRRLLRAQERRTGGRLSDPKRTSVPAYLQFLHLGEAGLAASMYFVVVSRNLAPEAERLGMRRRLG
jgi:DNA-directed RNA polymerase subunit RPC12/RpoP